MCRPNREPARDGAGPEYDHRLDKKDQTDRIKSFKTAKNKELVERGEDPINDSTTTRLIIDAGLEALGYPFKT